MLTPEDIEATYEELGKMFVALDPSPERGMTYIKERLTLGRAMQDRVAELRLRVNRALSDVMEQHLIAQQVYEISSTPDTKKKVKDLEILKHRHTMLGKMIAMQAQVLSRTAMDIRLLADLTKEQIKRGEVDPKEAPGLVQDVPVSDMATTPAVSDTLLRSEGWVPGTENFVKPPLGEGPNGEHPVEMTGFDQPIPVPDDTMKLEDTHSAVSFDDLFKETPNGETTAPIL